MLLTLGGITPPRMGDFGIISPRTCENCTIDTTLYWKLITTNISEDTMDTMVGGRRLKEISLNDILPHLTPHDKETLVRILGEPKSIMVKEDFYGDNDSL